MVTNARNSWVAHAPFYFRPDRPELPLWNEDPNALSPREEVNGADDSVSQSPTIVEVLPELGNASLS